MIQNLDIVSQQFLTNLQSLNQRTATTEAQVSSGTRISKPSDDPAALGDVLQLESDLGRATQVANNLNQVKGTVDTAEAALENATQILQQVATVGVQGASSISTATTRAGIAQQVQAFLSQLVSASNTSFNGQYVFGGDQNTPPYQLDLSNANGVDRLNGSTSTTLIQDATGVTFAVARTAQDIFDHRNSDDSLATDNVFAAVNSLRIALANNDSTGITNALAAVQTAQNYLSQQLSFYGGVQDQVANALDVAQKFQLQDQTTLSQKKDTDIAAAGIALTQEQTNLQAALQAEAAMPKTSLFSFISGTG